ncbi:MAG: ABC transporter ATP-binding protein [Myxococcota bacterium]|nr:ABC transporter ATP-binding protein [Myxococcota bacterium]
MDSPEILLEGVTKRFAAGGGDAARPRRLRQDGSVGLDRITLSVGRGEIVVVVGPSGCGKSTMLRVVAGLEQPDAGSVAIAGRSMTGVPPQDRDVAMVFQGYALYPQMTAREIMEFPLKMRGASRDQRARAVRDAAALLRIEPLLDRRPGELSGGERQRVAMGRAIVRKPRVFLFDEPLSSLDASLREDIRLEIGELVRRLDATALYVTHDHVEAMTLADRIAVMRAGRLLQLGTPREVYERPATSFVAAFLGSPRMNFLGARVEADTIVAGPFRLPKPPGSLPRLIQLGVRPEHVALGDAGESGKVIAVEPLGASTHVVVRVSEHDLRAIGRGFDEHRRGDDVRVAIDAQQVMVFDAEGDGARIA